MGLFGRRDRYVNGLLLLDLVVVSVVGVHG